MVPKAFVSSYLATILLTMISSIKKNGIVSTKLPQNEDPIKNAFLAKLFKASCNDIGELHARWQLNQLYLKATKDKSTVSMEQRLKWASDATKMRAKKLNCPLAKLSPKMIALYGLSGFQYSSNKYLSGNQGRVDTESKDQRIHRYGSKIRIRRQAREAGQCSKYWIGDGLCDLGCNSVVYNYDKGDCCYDRCMKRRKRYYPCGTVGFQCVSQNNKIPKWFMNNTALCYRYEPDGDPAQCGVGRKQIHCAKIGGMTPYYLDDTDGRRGGCLMSWKIQSPASPEWFKSMKICYRFVADTFGRQCDYGGAAWYIRERCSAVNEWTVRYRDNTNSVPGVCYLAWRIVLPKNPPDWLKEARLCFYWFDDESNGQCDTARGKQHICVTAGSWTPYYRDGTDHRKGGCHLAWGIVLG